MKSFILSKMFKPIIDELLGSNVQLANTLDIVFLIFDLIFIGGIILGGIGLAFALIKYGLRLVKANNDDMGDAQKLISYRKDLWDSMKGFAIISGALIILPIIAWVIIAIVQSSMA